MEKTQMLYEGKAKKVYCTDQEGIYIIEYKDDATAFNARKKGTIAGKGAVNNKMTSIIFEMLEANGIPTHFISRLDERCQIVKAVRIYPLEVIIRNTAAGSFSSRLGIAEGIPLSPAVLEFSYKNDELDDPLINDYHAAALKLADEAELETIKNYAFRINELLKEFFLKAGLKLIDFKIEFGNCSGEIILADEISPDTCRLWDAVTDEKMDKDRFRRDLGGTEEAYQEVLKRLSE